MIPLQLTTIAELTGGALHGPDVLVDGPVVSDSREAQPGSLYVARIGEHADGHQYASSAAQAGAVATLGLRPVAEMPTVVVPDVQEAFAQLARGVVDRCSDLQIIGITGSSGKTSTKDMLGHVLEGHGETISPIGSLNSEVGVPLTVCRVTGSTRYLVAEMGASGVGHIAYLTRIAPPQIGVVLNVGAAHVGEFGSVEAIARTKAELVRALPQGGVAILNVDDARVAAMAAETAARVVRVGIGADADLRAIEVRLDEVGRPSFTVVGRAERAAVRLQLHGAHQVGNALAVIAAARALELPMDLIVDRLASARAVSRWRMEVHRLPNDVTLVNDAYNANPQSMAAALRALGQMGAGRRTIAVLGEMRELGQMSAEAHQEVGRIVAELGVRQLIVVGDGARGIASGAAGSAVHVEQVADVAAAHDLLADRLRPGDVVLLKSSRDSGLRYLGDRLVTEAGGEVAS
ncbi:UDP-N-acetylmuramoyl-tripeptide--D-alanyl-D-alanine ligase [Leekyejoonella antrihumi]|uniref:UDP-N-acetylmuramoyl-tripeptide--D-alanyl-D-alanine ligase n=1 Tax=Leekyejoonella antrihumi TaxID=1660198 RepID=A0A563DY38_9MICO|nr:UDP-N-acetylmuramoyl-tripeptide--D-alanyl-D-alanine ligase [Leekyejoonella antrihumi]TWP35188.1 UDP-N-acetylmuramoyl-tripeptide--D-alanyl-D-alanine ligase [Leekyejoonella antrihumi]